MSPGRMLGAAGWDEAALGFLRRYSSRMGLDWGGCESEEAWRVVMRVLRVWTRVVRGVGLW
jgi:hypothetical protein